MNAHWKPTRTSAPALLQGGVRPLAREDLAAVARMFLRNFRGRRNGRSARLEGHLAHFFLDHPHFDAATASLVHETPDGRISGFLGISPVRMRFDGENCTGSIISTWMIDDAARDSRAAVALARNHLARRNRLTMSDTASRTSIGFQSNLRMEFSSLHSLRWLKPLDFVASGLVSAAGAIGIAPPPAAISAARACEQAARRLARRSGLAEAQGWRIEPTRVEAFAEGLAQMTARLRLAPVWSPSDLAWLLDFAREREGARSVNLYEARDPAGGLAGVCACVADDRRRLEVLQIVMRPRAEETVLQLLMRRAREEGMISIGGRLDPSVGRGLFTAPRVLYRRGPGMVLKTEDAEVSRAIAGGEGLIGGLVGDAWTPLARDSYA